MQVESRESDHGTAAGELVRWLPRQRSAGLTIPPNDFWVFDEKVVLWNYFDGDGSWIGEERADDPELAKLCAAAFDAMLAEMAVYGPAARRLITAAIDALE